MKRLPLNNRQLKPPPRRQPQLRLNPLNQRKRDLLLLNHKELLNKSMALASMELLDRKHLEEVAAVEEAASEVAVEVAEREERAKKVSLEESSVAAVEVVVAPVEVREDPDLKVLKVEKFVSSAQDKKVRESTVQDPKVRESSAQEPKVENSAEEAAVVPDHPELLQLKVKLKVMRVLLLLKESPRSTSKEEPTLTKVREESHITHMTERTEPAEVEVSPREVTARATGEPLLMRLRLLKLLEPKVRLSQLRREPKLRR